MPKQRMREPPTPRHLLFSQQNECLVSIVEFDLDADELFLTYTWDHGPGIQRSGKGPPYMVLGRGRGKTTHQFALRLGTWLIQADMIDAELKEGEEALKGTLGGTSSLWDRLALSEAVEELRKMKASIDKLREGACDLKQIKSHDVTFQATYGNYLVMGQQGCGDLTMNFWNVAFVNNGLNGGSDPLVYLPMEDLDNRAYSCLVKWKPSEGGVRRVTIEELEFDQSKAVKDPNERVWLRHYDQLIPRADSIEFAVSNQQVIRDGEIVPVVTNCHQFGDLRHLIQMPNLNPDREPLQPEEKPNNEGSYRPRVYFREEQHNDIWLGEAALIKDSSQNLLRAALAGPVFLKFPAEEAQLRGALGLASYREVPSRLEPLRPGEWRLVRRDPVTTVLEIYFKRNTYSWSMIGLTSDGRRILCLACTGQPGKTGHTLEEAANLLLQAGAYNALLIDEGLDVFQRVRWREEEDLQDIVAPQRRRVRGSFILARPRPSGKSDGGESRD